MKTNKVAVLFVKINLLIRLVRGHSLRFVGNTKSDLEENFTTIKMKRFNAPAGCPKADEHDFS